MSEFGVIEALKEVRIEAAPARVWEAFVDQTTAWWTYYSGKEPKRLVLEARIGGRVYEDWGDGQGQLWYTVVGLELGRMLMLTGDLDLDHGPARLFTTIHFKPDESGTATLLRLREGAHGHATPQLKSNLEQGWHHLLAECLKPYVEQDRLPEGRPPTLEA